MVNVWASANGLVPAKVAEKSNEITAIPKLLQLSNWHRHHRGLPEGDCTTDHRRGYYLLAVKKNQGRLYEDVCDLAPIPRPPGDPSMLGHHGPRLSGLHPDTATMEGTPW